MHKEIEEAREWSNARPSEFAVHDFKRWCLKGTIHARRLLFLYDRMQQEPVVEIEQASPTGGSLYEVSLIKSYNRPDIKLSELDGTYRRELEDK